MVSSEMIISENELVRPVCDTLPRTTSAYKAPSFSF
jgi:hypothetical protein